MRRSLLIAAAGSTTTVLLKPSRALAQGYPELPIRFICRWHAGGADNQSMRALSQVTSLMLDRLITLEKKSDASGVIGARAMAPARPDGYTTGQIPISVTHFSQPGILQLDPLKDFTSLARTSEQTFGIAASATSRFKSLREVVTFAKTNPGKPINVHADVGGATHEGMKEFTVAAVFSSTIRPTRALPRRYGPYWMAMWTAGRVQFLVTARRSFKLKNLMKS